MEIPEMHVWFRQYAQQMGMQNTRTILPEQIDLLINTSITDITNQIIRESIAATNDRVLTDSSKINQINALSTLYKVIEIDAEIHDTMTPGRPVIQREESYIQRLNAGFDYFLQGQHFSYLFLTNFDISYKYGDKVTNYFPIRVIDDIYLADSLNDYLLAPRVRSPIAVIHDKTLDIYIDKLVDGKLPQGLKTHKLRVSYVAKPAKVAYLQDITGNPSDNINCDLPEYLHVDILKHAVDLWRIATTGALYNGQQQEQAQQQDNGR